MIKTKIFLFAEIEEISTQLEPKDCTRVAIYSRVAYEAEENLLKQKRELETFVRSQDAYRLDGVYSEAGSGHSVPNLPQMKKLLKDCNMGKYDVVVIKSWDRLGRDFAGFNKLLQNFGRLGVKIKTLH